MIVSDSSIDISFAGKLKAFFELTKFRLSLTVVFSSSFGYLLGIQRPINWVHFALFAIAGYAITSAANTVNQIKEVELDKLMKRTAGRPLPTGRLSISEAWGFVILMLALSMFIFITAFNYKTAGIALLSFVLYGFVYTPLKRVGPIAVFVGAFPGAFPPMIGWLAATNHFGWEPGILFAIQFFWQFPHFWAIAWVADEDYRRAGFKLLPAQGEKGFDTAVQIMIYTLFLLPLSWVPLKLGMTGINSAIIAMICGILFLAQTFHLMRKQTDKAALKMMFGSFLYLPVVQIAFLLDKI
ncbi:heme o synthase [Cytophagaceae bacterium YF14B1]|uniref:Protoheme IX farnesyltransferase n=1 Tax=Xanthocytophaga flava TaxID=3048013 RepID=A0AAE3QLK9_9BACT|nr:heme o synthase [Xanthocytophaga flavus]MDJ1479171.1 heme o synthase [Xanthocytophaga flavus]